MSYSLTYVGRNLEVMFFLRSLNMGHDISASINCQPKDGKIESFHLASLRLFPSEAFSPGNIYEALECTNFRNSCCGNGGTAKFVYDYSRGYLPKSPNNQTVSFLEEVFSSFERNGFILSDGPILITFA